MRQPARPPARLRTRPCPRGARPRAHARAPPAHYTWYLHLTLPGGGCGGVALYQRWINPSTSGVLSRARQQVTAEAHPSTHPAPPACNQMRPRALRLRCQMRQPAHPPARLRTRPGPRGARPRARARAPPAHYTWY